MIGLPAFRMPPLPATWVDDDGREFAFGQRWGMGSPPDEAYRRIGRPQRFAPLHEVVDALLAHLLEAYDCTAEPDTADDGEVRAVWVRSAPGTAGVRLAWTDFPGVQARLGSGVGAAAPACGCDACDEPLDEAAAEFCAIVRAVVAGELVERPAHEDVDRRYRLRVGTGSAMHFTLSLAPDARRELAVRTPERWAAWPLRAG